MRPLTAFAVLLLTLVFALILATLLIPREQSAPIAISGSPIEPGYFGRTADNIFGPDAFITSAPDGEAFAEMRFATPRRFERMVHAYHTKIWPEHRIRKAVIQTSDDGSHWTHADQAEERDGKLTFNVSAAGAHQYWRMLVLESGEAPELIFGNLRYVTSDDIFGRIPIDLAWFCLVPALLLLFASLPRGLSPGRIFVSVAIPLALFVAFYTF